MPATPLYAKTTTIAATQTADVTAAYLRIIHGGISRMAAVSQADNVLLGRDRHPLFGTAKSTATAKSGGLRRVYAKASIAASDSAVCKYLITLPAPPAPVGEVFLNGKTLVDQRLAKGRSHSFVFTIIGKKLTNLQVRFSLRSLRGESVLQKTVLVAPGGVAIDEFITAEDGTQTITGYISLLPHETVFASAPAEFELNYLLEIGNGSSREYPLQSEYLNFYSV